MIRTLPQPLIDSLQNAEGFDEEAFRLVHASGEQITSIRINAAKIIIEEMDLPVESAVPWCSNGYYLSHRPSFTFDPLFHAGCYYVQEASSMFLETALQQTVDLSVPLKVLDLCASPGGKSTHLQSLLSPQSILVSNEVIKSRNNVLVDNIVKWGAANVIVTANDAAPFQNIPGYFDVMVVDAPCSGSGLFRRDEAAIDEWSPNNVQLCSQRQQRIVADALPALKSDGILIYSTCSYSIAEDEAIMDWLVAEMECESIKLNLENAPGVVESMSQNTGTAGYRFYPDKVKGEGFFIAVFRKKTGETNERYKTGKLEKLNHKQKEIVGHLINEMQWEGVRLYNGWYFLPPHVYDQLCVLQPSLNIQYAGVQLGEIMKDKLVPAHALALSGLLNENVPKNELNKEDAIRYLQRADFKLTTETKGWQVVCYQKHNLGWINALPNRFNNYYPKELRILKQHNGSAFEN